MDKKQILTELGDIPESVYDELVKEAFEQAERQLTEIESMLKCGDNDGAAQLAHSMKGCFANLRLEKISRAAKDLEIALRKKADSGNLQEYKNALKELLHVS